MGAGSCLPLCRQKAHNSLLCMFRCDFKVSHIYVFLGEVRGRWQGTFFLGGGICLPRTTVPNISGNPNQYCTTWWCVMMCCVWCCAVFRSTRISSRFCVTPSSSENWRMTVLTRTLSTKNSTLCVKPLSGQPSLPYCYCQWRRRDFLPGGMKRRENNLGVTRNNIMKFMQFHLSLSKHGSRMAKRDTANKNK